MILEAKPTRRRHGAVLLPKLARPKIAGVGTYVPPGLLTNQDLEKMVETSNEWILERTGIRERHIADKGTATSDLAAAAALQLLKNTGTTAADIDLIIVATVTPDMMFPATACLVQNKIGASHAWGFDLSAACSGFLYALEVGATFITAGTHKKVMVIGADMMSAITDYTDRKNCILFGDGAGAVLLEDAGTGEAAGDIGMIDFLFEVDGVGGPSLCMPGGGSQNPASHETIDKRMHYLYQDGPTVFKFATRKIVDLCTRLLERNNLTCEDIDLFIPHQANKRIINAAAERLGLAPDRIIINIDEYGNTTAATVPLAMQTALTRGKLKRGDLVLLATVGAGFTAGASILRWAY